MNASRKLILAVAELHRRGFEKLRIEAGLSPSGCHWRYRLVTKDGQTKGPSGSLTNQLHMSWEDTPDSSPEQLADIITSKFPDLVDAAKGTDQAYKNWLSEIIEESTPDGLFIELWDSYDGPCKDVRLISCQSERRFPQAPL
ncbi:hypothetical protein N9Z18_01745 [Verrucomicrobiales bacterium]|nr:hypothetical protein [Verrucomicrobiales bacterium]MDA7926983.1 hypothetical protein [Verrucomicrobiales bacterium]MDB4358945.1 hypothetical protein [Verrucomicrobiales bacterium]|tara:strand:- start:89 stop:514 length:426 start_codon:yes stop_codon:yes gene_type:complete